MAIAANALAGAAGLAAWQVPRWRGRWVWLVTGVAEVAILVQVTTGVILESSERFAVDRFHMFYGFVAFVTVTLAYSSRESMRGRLELLYGLVGLFLMGLGIRAWQQVV